MKTIHFILFSVILATSMYGKCNPNYYKADTYKYFSQASADYMNSQSCKKKKVIVIVEKKVEKKVIVEKKVEIPKIEIGYIRINSILTWGKYTTAGKYN